MSVPRDAAQVPVYYNRYRTGRPGSVDYRDMTCEPLFSFGFGLTYTTFAYEAPRILPAVDGNPAAAAVTISNTGNREGSELVQLYIRQLACHEAARPEQELRGFKRVRLQPGEKAEVRFPLDGGVLGHWRRDGKWHADEGSYHIWLAPHARTGLPLEFSFSR